MPIPVSSIISVASLVLQDPSNTRWTVAEHIEYINAGVKLLVSERPDSSAKKTAFTPSAGARQAMPSDAVSLIDIIGNNGGVQRSITKINIDDLSAISRDWQSGSKSSVSRHFMYDLRDPYNFYLYPPSDGTGGIDLLYSVFPADVTSGVDILALPLLWKNALINYDLARCFAKDAEYGGNAQAAAAYMGAFSTEIGGQLQSAAAVAPKQ